MSDGNNRPEDQPRMLWTILVVAWIEISLAGCCFCSVPREYACSHPNMDIRCQL